MLVLMGCAGMLSGCGSDGDEAFLKEVEVFEDKSGSLTVDQVLQRSFQACSNSVPAIPESTTWLRMRLHNEEHAPSRLALSFGYISNVTLYDISSGIPAAEYSSGFLCPRNRIEKGHSEGHFEIDMAPDEEKRFLLKADDQMRLSSHLIVKVERLESYLRGRDIIKVRTALFIGAYAVLIIFLLAVMLIAKAPRHIIWLLFNLVFLILYSQSLKGSLISSLFPDDPILGWSFNESLYQFAFVAGYLFSIAYWRISEISRRTHNVFVFLAVFVALKGIFSFIYFLLTHDSGTLLIINMVTLPFETIMPGILVFRHREKFSREQKVVLWTVLFVFISVIVRTVFYLVEQSPFLSSLSLMVDCGGILVGFTFATGLIVESQNRLVERNETLRALNKVQQGQKEHLEQVVAERTKEVRDVNATLEEKNQVLAQRNVMIRNLIDEVHHRVKNNFQLVRSLLETRSSVVEDSKTVKMLDDVSARIYSMALLHKKLYEKEGVEKVDFREYVVSLVEEIERIYQQSKQVRVEVESPPFKMGIDIAVTLGLILSELVTNAYKYGFDKENPHLRIGFSQNERSYFVLMVWDNGESTLPAKTPRSRMGYGLRLVHRLAKQLYGKVETSNTGGTRFEITFQDKNKQIKLVAAEASPE